MVEFHQAPDGERAFPVEYKRGRPKANRADEVQLCAQALCLESMLGQRIDAGALYYGATRRRVEVLFDDGLRQLTLETIAAVRAMLVAGHTPTARYRPRLCDACSLLDLCQPRLLGRDKGVNVWLAEQWSKDMEGESCADS
ncbi:CRISPR-associated protein Cas4 [Achromobacter sp. DMS1]|uniref:CRISPR-associated protein Cas4 n=1 Tax=Achromobacter sp. DMS1 TaxID=1688405 RepID=UPI000AA151C1|nr:CRISPR-associated protein Cas4 [Achromobacter sp. DMS1]